jgi:mannose-6-phosphate isomerase-like protein (cupin superfamily)
MTKHAFFIADDRVIHVANPAGAGFQYRAQPHALPPHHQAGPFQHEGAETVVVVCEGIVEVMINGAAAVVGAGSFVRVPPNAMFAYRNAGDEVAHLLHRTAPANHARQSCKVTIQLTAA